MDTSDIIILILLLLGAVKGYMNGLIIEIFSFLAFFIGLFFALKLTIPASTWLIGKTDHFDVFAILIFVGLFILISILIRIGAKFLKNAIDVTPLGILDNAAGAISGIFKVSLVISVILWVFSYLGIDFHSLYAADSIIFPYIIQVAPEVFDTVGYIIPMMQDFIDSMDKIPNKKTHIIVSLI